MLVKTWASTLRGCESPVSHCQLVAKDKDQQLIGCASSPIAWCRGDDQGDGPPATVSTILGILEIILQEKQKRRKQKQKVIISICQAQSAKKNKNKAKTPLIFISFDIGRRQIHKSQGSIIPRQARLLSTLLASVCFTTDNVVGP